MKQNLQTVPDGCDVLVVRSIDNNMVIIEEPEQYNSKRISATHKITYGACLSSGTAPVHLATRSGWAHVRAPSPEDILNDLLFARNASPEPYIHILVKYSLCATVKQEGFKLLGSRTNNYQLENNTFLVSIWSGSRLNERGTHRVLRYRKGGAFQTVSFEDQRIGERSSDYRLVTGHTVNDFKESKNSVEVWLSL